MSNTLDPYANQPIDVDAFVAFAKARGAQRLDDLRDYVTTLNRDAPKLDLNPALAAAQSLHECADRETASKVYVSVPWTYGLNPAGIGVESDALWRVYDFKTGEHAARVQLLQLFIYFHGIDLPAGFSSSESPRWPKTIAAKPSRIACATTVEDLNGMWATDDTYAAGILKWYARILAAGIISDVPAGGVIVPDPTTGDTTVSSTWTKDNVYVIVTMGHRSDNDAGDPTEKAKTQYNAIADQKAFRAAGFRCDIWQQDLDGDGRPTMTTGGLDTVALGVGKAMKAYLAKNPTGLVILLDDHYNGPSSAVHVIVPDVGGMGTAYAGGAPGDDTAANNTLDYALALAIAANISKATGMPLLAGRFGANGVMSEQDTGVGITYNARLAMMAATAPYRANAIRLVVEHGGYNMAAATQADFYAKCATAKVTAVQAVLGIAAGQGDGTGGATPPTPLFTPAVAVPELAAYIGKGDTIASLPAAGVKAANGVTWNPAGYNVATIEETARLAGDSLTSGSRGPNIPKDHEFGVLAWGVGTDGNLLYLTPGLTRVDARKVRIAAPGVLSKAA